MTKKQEKNPQSKKAVVPFPKVIQALLDAQTPFPPAYLHRFSDLSNADLTQLKLAWPNVTADRRAALMEDLEDLAENDTLVFFETVARFGLEDSDPRVRASSIRMFWETEDNSLAPVFMKMMVDDPDVTVRATAASGLGYFDYIGELEELPQDLLTALEDALIKVCQGTDEPLVRRRALEAMGFSSRPEVVDMIKAALASDDTEWLASALYAMGRSANERWIPDVLAKLLHPNVDVQLEAVRAAGELEIKDAREPLLRLLDHAEELDLEVRLAAAWSLSKIGGEMVRETIERLIEEAEDDDEADLLGMAMDNIDFAENVPGFGMFDFLNDDEEPHIIDLTQSDEDEDDDDWEENGDDGEPKP